MKRETIEIYLQGQRYRAERRTRMGKSRWVLMEMWDNTEADWHGNGPEEFGWVFLLPNEQLEVQRLGTLWTTVDRKVAA